MRLHKITERARAAVSWFSIVALFLTIIAAVSSSYAIGNKAALDTQSAIQQAVDNEKIARLDHESRFITRDEFSSKFFSELEKLHSQIDDLRVLIERRQH